MPNGETTDQKPDLRLNITFSEKTAYDEDLRLLSRGTRCVISWHHRHGHAKWNREQQAWDDPNDPRLFTRLKRSLEEHLGATAYQSEDESPEIQVDMDSKRRRITIWSTDSNPHDIAGAIQDTAQRWRNGHLHGPPVVNDKVHHDLAANGIRLRSDGLFGYHLPCQREDCQKETDTCYATVDAHDAIHDKTTRRSLWCCSTSCVMLLDWSSYVEGAGLDVYEMPSALSKRLMTYQKMHIPHALLDLDVETIHSKDPALWEDFVAWVKENRADSDYFQSDAGEIACET